MASDLAGATNEESIDVGVKEEKIKTPLKCRNPYSTLPKMGKSGSRIISETIWHLSQIRLQTSSDINQKQTNKQTNTVLWQSCSKVNVHINATMPMT